MHPIFLDKILKYQRDLIISLPAFLANKLKNFWRIVTKEDPTIEIKARMIEKSLREGATDEQIKQNLINNHFFNMVA